jgi:hypothetical protein
VQSVAAAIGLVRPPFHEAPGFQIVYDRDQAAGERSEGGRKRLLGHARLPRQDSKDSRMSGNQLQLVQPFRESRRRVRANLD